MDIFGIGPLEILLIAIIVLLVLGPTEMVKALRTIGSVLRSIVTSDLWKSTSKAIDDVRKLPYDLMREAGMEEDLKALDEIRKTASGKNTPNYSANLPDKDPNFSAWTQPNPQEPENQLVENEQSVEQQEIEPSILPPIESISDTATETNEMTNQADLDSENTAHNQD